MRRILFLWLWIPFFTVYSQQSLDCNWVANLKTATNLSQKLQILQENFDPCVLVLVDTHAVIPGSSSFSFRDEKLFIQMMREDQIASFKTVFDEEARNTYGPRVNAVAIITFKNKRTLGKILRRVKRQVRKSGKL